MISTRNEMYSGSTYAGGPTGGSPFQSLLYTVFQRPREEDGRGMVVGITSADSGAGVSYVTRNLVHELGKWKVNAVAQVNVRALRNLGDPSVETFQESMSRSTGNLFELKASGAPLILADTAGRWDGSRQYRQDCIELLRREFDYAIIDCPSLKESGELLSIAPFLDGVILVVEANKTQRAQLAHVERTIEGAQGKILGHILNKRTYEIPTWVYRRIS